MVSRVGLFYPIKGYTLCSDRGGAIEVRQGGASPVKENEV